MEVNPFSTRSPYEEVEDARRARLVAALCTRTVLLSVPLVILMVVLLALHYSPTILAAAIFCFAITPVSIVNRWLTQQGKHDLAAHIQLSTLLLAISGSALLIDGFFPILTPGYLVIIVNAGTVLRPKASFGMTGIVALMFLAAQILHASGVPTASLPAPLSTAAVTIMVISTFAFVANTGRLATRDLRRALDEATFKLVHANRKLVEASEMKSQFTARTSHELRTPLSSMIVFTELALREAYGPINAKLRTALTHVLMSARRLKAIINDILDISKIEAGQLEIVEVSFPLSHLVEAAQSASGGLAQEKGLRWSMSVSPDMPPYLLGDEGRLAQILVNLTTNAVKFTERGKVEVRLETHGHDRWRMAVHDTGPGIPEDQFETVFQGYRQLDSTAHGSKIMGTGLGLAITRYLARMMGGSVILESELGKGSTFTVELPLKVGEPVHDILQPVAEDS
jgi:signal transduction histidine kinase